MQRDPALYVETYRRNLALVRPGPVHTLAAVGLNALRPGLLRYGTLAAVVILCAVGAGAHYLRIMHPQEFPHRPGIHPPVESDRAAHFVRENMEENDLIWHTAYSSWLPFYWYGIGDYPQYFAAHNEEHKSHITVGRPVNTDNPVFLRLWPQVIDTLVPGHDRIWLVYSEWERIFLMNNPANVYRWLDARYIEVEHKSFAEIDVLLFKASAHPDAPQPVKRDEDTGITAHMHYETWDAPYEKRMPHSVSVPWPAEQRAGALRLRFDHGATDNGANGESGTVHFVVENTASEPATCDVHFLASAALLSCVAFDRQDPYSNTWRTGRMPNPDPLPYCYSTSTLSANLQHGSATVHGAASLFPGHYVPLLYTMAPWGTQEHCLAPVTITIGDTPLIPEAASVRDAAGQWTWLTGAPVAIQSNAETPITVETKPLSESCHGYAHLAHLAFVSESQFMEDRDATLWREQMVIPPNSSHRWAVAMPEQAARVDIWVYERGEDGRAYHIFQAPDASR